MGEMCAYAGTGNVLKVQELLHSCDEHLDMDEKDDEAVKKDGEKKEDSEGTEEKVPEEKGKEKEKKDDTYQAFAVLGIALVAMGEDIGSKMSLRQFNHLVSVV